MLLKKDKTQDSPGFNDPIGLCYGHQFSYFNSISEKNHVSSVILAWQTGLNTTILMSFGSHC